MSDNADTESHDEILVKTLNDPAALAAYKAPYDNYPLHAVPKALGTFLIFCGNTVYGHEPSYAKFRAVEVIARVPYQSWESAAYTLLTLCYTSEKRALRLSAITRFARIAEDNETMHVVVISQLMKQESKQGNFLTRTLIPLIFALFYFWVSYLLYLIKPRYSLELNYAFENHAFEQYQRFLEIEGDALRKKPVMSDFLAWYGREARTQYELFQSIRNDEVIHRNRSVHEIALHEK